MQKVVNGVVSVDPDKWTKLVKQEPIDLYYQVEEEPFARYQTAANLRCPHCSVETGQRPSGLSRR